MAANGKEAGKQDYLVQQITDFFNAKNPRYKGEAEGYFYLEYQASDGMSQGHVFYDFDEITIEENGDYKAYNLRELIEKELDYKKAVKSYFSPRIFQFGTLLKDEIYSILSQHRFALPGSIDGERVRQNKLAMEYFKSPDKFTEAALVIAELESVDDIFDYINDELKKDEKTARFMQALYEIKIAVFHKMIDKEGRYYKLVEFLKYVHLKIEETREQEIQSKWQELKDHIEYRMEFLKDRKDESPLMNITYPPVSSFLGSDLKVNQVKESEKTEAEEDKTHSWEIIEEAEHLLLLKRDIYQILTKYNETKGFQDDFAKVALKVSGFNSAKEICGYLSQEIRECRHNASLSFFAEALSDIRILAFHKMVEHEFSYNEIKSEFEYVNDKIKDTEGQEIQSKWKGLSEHMATKMKAMEKEQAEKTAPQSISEYSSGYFASGRKSSIISAGREIFSGLKPRTLFGNK